MTPIRRSPTDDRSDVTADSSFDPEDAVDWIERVMRVGWLAKGFVFVVIGLLALDLALGTSFGDGDTDEPANQRGALRSIAEEPLGTALLLAIAGGLAVFALWKVVQAFAARSGDVDPLGVAKRIGWAGLGLFYGVLGWTALQLALGSSGSSRSNGTSPSALTAEVIAVSGWFLVRAAIRFDPSDAVGLDGALRELAEVGYGRAVLTAVSIGLLVAGVYDMATFRRQRM